MRPARPSSPRQSPPPDARNEAAGPIPAAAVAQALPTPGLQAPDEAQGSSPPPLPWLQDIDMARWPDLAQRELFQHLKLADLLALGQACRQWKPLACDPHWQTLCLQNTLPDAHRQQMERALDAEAVRFFIEPWCDRTEEDSGPPSPQQLLCTAMERLLLTSRFHPWGTHRSTRTGEDIDTMLCSPDGRLLAASLHKAGEPHCTRVALWQQAADALVPLHAQPHNSPVSAMAFSSDSRRLRSLFKTGEQVVQHEDPAQAGRWIATHPGRLCPGIVHKAVVSPCGTHLAVVLRNSLLIYGEDRVQGWAEPALWGRTWEQPELFLLLEPDRLVTVFSDNGRHLLVGWGPEVFICYQEGHQWQAQELALEAPLRGQPVFDPASRYLVLASGRGSDKGVSVSVCIRFWHFEEARGWVVVETAKGSGRMATTAIVHPRSGYRVPAAFSPDGQLVALPSRSSCREGRLLPHPGQPAWARARNLPVKAWQGADTVLDYVCSLEFSASSLYLALVSTQGVELWQRQSAPDLWSPCTFLRSLDPGGRVLFAFSPDGYHCAACVKKPGAVHLAGPVGLGRYASKLYTSVPDGGRIERMFFTPDGTRLQIASSFRHRWSMGDDAPIDDFCISSDLLTLNLAPNPGSLPRPSELRKSRAEERARIRAQAVQEVPEVPLPAGDAP